LREVGFCRGWIWERLDLGRFDLGKFDLGKFGFGDVEFGRGWIWGRLDLFVRNFLFNTTQHINQTMTISTHSISGAGVP